MYKFADQYLWLIYESVPSSKNCKWLRYPKAARIPTFFFLILWCPYVTYKCGLWDYRLEKYPVEHEWKEINHALDREMHFRKMAYITDVVVNGVAALQIVLALILVQYDKYKKKREEIFVGAILYPLHS